MQVLIRLQWTIVGCFSLQASCYLARSPAAARIETRPPEAVSRCVYLRDLSASAGTLSQAKNEVLENAVRCGATVVVWRALADGGYHASAHGGAYRCHVRAAQILFSYAGALSAPASTRRSRGEAQAAAESVLARLRRGASFAELAAKESDCPSRQRGGDLGFLGRGSHTPAFERAAAPLRAVPVGWLGIIESPYGFHVILRTG